MFFWGMAHRRSILQYVILATLATLAFVASLLFLHSRSTRIENEIAGLHHYIYQLNDLEIRLRQSATELYGSRRQSAGELKAWTDATRQKVNSRLDSIRQAAQQYPNVWPYYLAMRRQVDERLQASARELIMGSKASASGDSTLHNFLSEQMVLIASDVRKESSAAIHVLFDQLDNGQAALRANLIQRVSVSIGGFVLVTVLLLVAFSKMRRYKAGKSASDLRYKYLVEESGFITALLNRDGIIQYISQPIFDIGGYKPAELIGLKWDTLLADDSKYIARQFETNSDRAKLMQQLEFKVKCKNGEEKWLSGQLFPIRDEGGMLREVQVVVWDVNDEKQTRQLVEQLQMEKDRQQQLMQNLIDTVPAGVFLKTVDGRFVMVNDYMQTLTGYPAADMLERRIADVAHDENLPLYESSDAQILETRSPVTYEHWYTASNGRQRYLVTTKYPLLGAHGQLEYIAGISTDFTAQKEQSMLLEKAKAEAEEAKHSQEVFMANISHEIRTPMNGVLGMTNLLQQTQLSAEQHEYLQAIHESALSLVSLINDLLDFSKIRSGKFDFDNRPFDPRKVFEKCMKPFHLKAREKMIAVDLQIHESVPACLMGDALRLEQIIINLVGNAVKFTQEGGVKVEVAAQPLADNGQQGKMQLHCRVTDTGVGIPAGRLQAVFDAFVQSSVNSSRKFGGTGLGLAIVKQLVEMQQGTVTVASKEGEGSVFDIVIPYAEANVADLPVADWQQAQVAAGLLEGLRILVAEDNSINQKVIVNTLYKQGAEVVLVDSGTEAIACMQRQRFDLVLMDLQMPVMGGLEATQLIRRQLRSKTPIVAMTADALKDEQARCLAAGMQAFVSKPFEPAELFALIRRLTGRNDDTTIVAEQPPPPPTMAPTPAAALPAKHRETTIDLTPLHTIANGDKRFIDEVLKTFVRTIPDKLGGLKAAMEQKDAATAAAMAHQLKPTFGMIKVGDVYERLIALDGGMKKDGWQQALADEHVEPILAQASWALTHLQAMAPEAIVPDAVAV